MFALAWSSKTATGAVGFYADALRLDELAARVLPLTGRSLLAGLVPLVVLAFVAGALGPSAAPGPRGPIGRSP